VGLALCFIDEQAKDFPRTSYQAQDIEMTIANRRHESSSSYEFDKYKDENKKSSKPSKALTKEYMTTFTEEPIQISRTLRPKENKGSSSRDKGRK